MKPTLTLVGAGPGDGELITLKGIRAIQSADVILYDALANTELLDYARPDTPMLFVGKRCGGHAYTQGEINYLIVENARKYGHVVRLKGGDPFVFGRGYEEVDYAQQHGIKCTVVPGVSSCIAVPESQGIPVTSRGYAESFWVMTGTTQSGELSQDVYLAAQSTATVVILMGMHKLSAITQLFEAAGRSDTPMAIIQSGTTHDEKCVLGTVSDIPVKVSLHQLSNPAVIVIGEVVRLHPAYVQQYVEQRYL
ncbi:MAG: uroporphyrinogen-III C-methyltransferase [Spirosomataceae bacterium]